MALPTLAVEHFAYAAPSWVFEADHADDVQDWFHVDMGQKNRT